MGRVKLLAAAIGATLLVGNANAISITSETDANALWNAVAGGIDGITVNSISLSGQALVGTSAVSSGTFTNGTGTYGIGPGIVLSSGDVNDYNDGPNNETGNTTNFNVPATVAQEAVLDTITGGSLNHFDVTEFTVNFDVDNTVDTIFFNLVFGSDEYDEFVGSSFIDAFGIFLNGANETLVGGLPINIDHPDMAFVGGTELDGILAPNGNTLLGFALDITPGSTNNTLNFIIADSGDTALDSTVYISGIGSVEPDPDPEPGVPVPATLLLLGAGLVGMGYRRRRA